MLPSPVLTNQSSHFVRACSGKLSMAIVPARIWCENPVTYIDTYAMLDPGSNATYCTKALRNQLEAQGTVHHLEMTTLTQSRMSIKTTVVTLVVSNTEGSDITYTIEATARPSLNTDLSGWSTQFDIEQWPHLRDLEIPKLKAAEVHLLIGQDSSDLLILTDVRRGGPGEPFAIFTPPGWAINGPVNPFGEQAHTSYFVWTCTPLEADLKRLWEIPDAHVEERGWSVSGQKSVNTWNSTLQEVDNHYFMSIPFNAQPLNLPNNKLMAEKRLQSLARHLSKDKTLKCK